MQTVTWSAVTSSTESYTVHATRPATDRLTGTGIYANPVSSFVQAETGSDFQMPVGNTLSGITGKTVSRESSGLHHLTMEAAHFRRGLYVLKLSATRGDVVRMEKIILE